MNGRMRIQLLTHTLMLLATVNPATAMVQRGEQPSADTTFAGDWGAQGKWLFDRADSGWPTFMPDETGGFFTHWTRYGVGNSDTVRVTRFTAQGELAPGWTNDGVAVHQEAEGSYPRPIADGEGGLYVHWADTTSAVHELRLQHVLGDGRLDPDWPIDGRVVPIVTRSFREYEMRRDDARGFILAWYGATLRTREDIRVVRLDEQGGLSPSWPDSGVQVTTLPTDSGNYRFYAFLVALFPSTNGNLIVQYGDWFSCSGHGCYDFNNQDASLVGPAGVISTSHPGVSLSSRQLVPDSQGGAFSFFNSGGNRWIMRLWASQSSYTVLSAGDGIASDSVGGVLLSIGQRFSRLDANCVLNPAWGGESGRVITSSARPGVGISSVADRVGGFFFAWRDVRRDSTGAQGEDLYAVVIRADGTVAPGWAEGGLPVVTRTPMFQSPGLLPLAREQALLYWHVYDDATQKYSFYGQRLSVDQPVPTQVSLVSAVAHADRIALEWFAADDEGAALTVERTDNGNGWHAIANVYADGTGHIVYADRDVRAGSQYGYRLRDSQRAFAETWVTMPLATQFGIHSATPSAPSRIRVEFSAEAGADVEISLFDLVGRRITRSRVAASGDASQSVELDAPNALAPGLYLVRVAAGEQSAQRRVMITR